MTKITVEEIRAMDEHYYRGFMAGLDLAGVKLDVALVGAYVVSAEVKNPAPEPTQSHWALRMVVPIYFFDQFRAYNYGPTKISFIKALRSELDLGLRQAKELFDSAHGSKGMVLMSNVDLESAQDLRQRMVKAIMDGVSPPLEERHHDAVYNCFTCE